MSEDNKVWTWRKTPNVDEWSGNSAGSLAALVSRRGNSYIWTIYDKDLPDDWPQATGGTSPDVKSAKRAVETARL